MNPFRYFKTSPEIIRLAVLYDGGRYRVACQAQDVTSADLCESAAVLTAVKDKARGPAALLDRRLRAPAWRCQIGTAE